MILAREAALYEVAPRPCHVICPSISLFPTAVGLAAVLLAFLKSMLEATGPNESTTRRAVALLAPTIWTVVPGWAAGAACVLLETVSLALGAFVPTPTFPVFVLL